MTEAGNDQTLEFPTGRLRLELESGVNRRFEVRGAVVQMQSVLSAFRFHHGEEQQLDAPGSAGTRRHHRRRVPLHPGVVATTRPIARGSALSTQTPSMDTVGPVTQRRP
jgi:hypothetical protein